MNRQTVLPNIRPRRAPRFRRTPRSLTRVVLLMAGDGLAICAAFILATVPVYLFGRFSVWDSPWDLLVSEGPGRVYQVGVFGALLLLWFLSNGHYTVRPPFWLVFRAVVGGCVIALLADAFLQFALQEQFSRLWLVHTWLLSVPAILMVRKIVRHGLGFAGWWAIPVVIVGQRGGRTLTEAMALLQEDEGLGYAVVGEESLDGLRETWGGHWDDMLAYHRAQVVVLALEDSELAGHGDLLSRLMLQQVPFVSMRSLGGLPVVSVEARHTLGHDMIVLSGESPLFQPLGRGLKVLSDYIGAVLICLISLPLLLVLVPVIRLDGGAVFYAHRRVGRNGHVFDCLKFRTMVPNAEAVLDEVLAADPVRREEWSRFRKLRDDPRVTRVGRFLRAFSLDELPQCLNVLRGEMSLVGPRPITAEELGDFGEDVAFYLSVKPGISGLWQVSGRSTSDCRQRVQLTVWYLKNWSLWIDAAILLRTVQVALSRHGAW